MHVIQVTIEHEGYGCVACQVWHEAGDPLYAEHLHRQSKHGVVRWSQMRRFAAFLDPSSGRAEWEEIPVRPWCYEPPEADAKRLNRGLGAPS